MKSEMKSKNTVNDLLLLNRTWIRHPVLNCLSDLHGDPGSLCLQWHGAGVDVTLSGGALFIWPQQLATHTDQRHESDVREALSSQD